jgi:hypothetical protein
LRFEPGFLGQLEQQLKGARADQVLGVIQQQVVEGQRIACETFAVLAEQVAQMQGVPALTIPSLP